MFKLRILGFICPGCGEKAERKGRQRDRIDQWIGYVYPCECSGCISDWWMLFDDHGHFCGVVREREMFDAGGVRQRWEFPPLGDVDEIPF